MATLASELRSKLTALDASGADDMAYRNAFSSATRNRLQRGQTWRLRLLRWCEAEERFALVQAQNPTQETSQ